MNVDSVANLCLPKSCPLERCVLRVMYQFKVKKVYPFNPVQGQLQQITCQAPMIPFGIRLPVSITLNRCCASGECFRSCCSVPHWQLEYTHNLDACIIWNRNYGSHRSKNLFDTLKTLQGGLYSDSRLWHLFFFQGQHYR